MALRHARAARSLACVGLLGFALVVAGPARAADYSAIRTVGIIAAVGDTVTRQMEDGFASYRSRDRLPIADWNIDGWLATQIAYAVSPRFAVKAVAYSAAQFQVLDSSAAVAELVGALSASNGVDAYVVVHRQARRSDKTGVTLSGLGIYNSDSVFGGEYDAAYAFYAVTVVDARNGAVIADVVARLPDGSETLREADSEIWSDPFQETSDEQMARIKAALFGLLRDSLPGTLKDTGLTAAPSQAPVP